MFFFAFQSKVIPIPAYLHVFLLQRVWILTDWQKRSHLLLNKLAIVSLSILQMTAWLKEQRCSQLLFKTHREYKQDQTHMSQYWISEVSICVVVLLTCIVLISSPQINIFINHCHCSLYFSLIAVTVGFDPTTYRVNESDGSVAIIIRVLKGMLAKQVNLSFSTENDAAQGKTTCIHVCT